MAEHTFNIPSRQETTRFDNGDELHLHASREGLSELEAARALVAATESRRLEKMVSPEQQIAAELKRLSTELTNERRAKAA